MELTVCPENTEDTEWNFALDPDDCMLRTDEKSLFDMGAHCRHDTFSARVSLYIQLLKNKN